MDKHKKQIDIDEVFNRIKKGLKLNDDSLLILKESLGYTDTHIQGNWIFKAIKGEGGIVRAIPDNCDDSVLLMEKLNGFSEPKLKGFRDQDCKKCGFKKCETTSLCGLNLKRNLND